MENENRKKTKTGLIATIVFAFIVGVVGISFAAWGGHGAGNFRHGGGHGGYGHNGGCLTSGMHRSLY